LCQPQFPDQIIANTGFPVDDMLKYRDPRRMRQDLELQSQPVLFVCEYF
jgi:hypothetical protein